MLRQVVISFFMYFIGLARDIKELTVAVYSYKDKQRQILIAQGKDLQSKRLALGITKMNLASEFNLQQSELTRFEDGTTPIPKFLSRKFDHFFRKIAEQRDYVKWMKNQTGT
jgi:hypothetical protein